MIFHVWPLDLDKTIKLWCCRNFSSWCTQPRWCPMWCGPAPAFLCWRVVSVFVSATQNSKRRFSFQLLHFLSGQNSFQIGQLGYLSSRNCCLTPSFFKHSFCNFIAAVAYFVGDVVCSTWCFYWKRTKLAMFTAKSASAELLFLFWIGFAVVRESGDFFLTSHCFVSLKQVQQANLSYVASEKWFKENDRTTCIQTSCRLLFARRLLEICRFWAPLTYLPVVGFPAVVVTGIANQVWIFPVPPWCWWSMCFPVLTIVRQYRVKAAKEEYICKPLWAVVRLEFHEVSHFLGLN